MGANLGAEREGFEPPDLIGLPLSRRVHSAALPPFRRERFQTPQNAPVVKPVCAQGFAGVTVNGMLIRCSCCDSDLSSDYCPACGELVFDDWMECPRCGRRADAPILCTLCAESISDGSGSDGPEKLDLF